VSDPICDITEVTFAGSNAAFSTIGQIADVGAVGSNSVSAIYRAALLTVTASGSVSRWDRYSTRVTVHAVGSNLTIDHLSAYNLVSVSAKGSAVALQVLRDLAVAQAAGSVTVLEDPPRDLAVVAASAAVVAIQARMRSMVTVRANASNTITNPNAVRQIVTVAASAAVAVLQHLTARSFVTVTAEAAAEMLADHATRRQMVTVTAAASVAAIQTLTARNFVTVEADAETEIVEPFAGNPAWSAPTETLGMSRHVYPVALRGLAPLDDVMLAIGDAGIYILNGDNDGAGTPDILATVTGPLVDTGDSALKHPLALYVSYTSTKPISVAVGETSTGAELTYTYTSPAFSQSAPRPIRIPTGRGLRSRYLRFAISNTAGAPLTVYAAEHDYIQTGRRT